MFGTKKLKALIWSVIISMLASCGEVSMEQKSAIELSGNAQGTTYSIIVCDEITVTKDQIDSVLNQFDNVLSTYVDNSIISRINNADDSITIIDSTGWFERCYNLSQEVFQKSKGSFDPSIMPLVDAWGFYRKESVFPSERECDSLCALVSFQNGKLHTFEVEGSELTLRKLNKHFRLDFNAVAQGLAVDVLADFLKQKGAKNFYIELGGEIVVAGKNREGDDWRIGIDSPEQSDSVRIIDKIMNVSNKGIATSGNYRKFYLKDGVKYAHTIDPIKGTPVQHTLLSATVVSENAGLSDAWATAFMVLGKDEAVRLLHDGLDKELDVYFIYDDGNGNYAHWMSKGFEAYLSN